jgi:RND superfamily putative drug exporter
LVVAVLALLPLAAFAPGIRMSFDENALQPHSKNARALAALNTHFPHHATLPDFLLLTGNADLRTPAALAAFARPAAALAAVPGVTLVHSPADLLTMDRTVAKSARVQFVSKDGHTARILVSGDANPLGPEGRHRLRAEQAALRTALADPALAATPLAGARLEVTGAAAFGADLHDLVRRDMTVVTVMVLAAVFLILVMVLRALVAPLYLLASVVLSFAAAVGITELVWHDLMGHQIEWFLPIVTFVFLVAVGADYNLLLTARIREETEVGDRPGIARAVVSTGGVITSAGLIFAGSFLALVPAPMTGMAEVGFSIAVGLLLDTLIVRTLIVPAAAMLLGPWNWWPRRPTDQPRTAGQGRSSAAGALLGTAGD